MLWRFPTLPTEPLVVAAVEAPSWRCASDRPPAPPTGSERERGYEQSCLFTISDKQHTGSHSFPIKRSMEAAWSSDNTPISRIFGSDGSAVCKIGVK